MLRQIIIFFGRLFFLLKSKNIPCEVKKILISRSGGIGDVLMSTPLVRAIRKRYPKAKISYLVGEWSKEVLEGNKDINEIIAFEDEIIFKKRLFKVLRLIKKIKGKKFDLCFVLDKHYMWNLFDFFCKIPFRVGFNRKGEGFPNNLNVHYDGSKHELDYYLDIAKLLDIDAKDKKMRLFAQKKDIKFANDFIKKNKLKNIIGVAAGGAENPGQRMFVKRWPKENYESLIKKLTDSYNILLFGGKNDLQLNESIIKQINGSNSTKKIKNVAGITLKQSAALMQRCKLFITHDSGPMHLASTTKTKLIVLFGPTPSERFAPKNAIAIKSKLDCCPCYDIYGDYKKCTNPNCMRAIDVNQILKKIK